MTDIHPNIDTFFLSSGCLTQKALEDMARGSLSGKQLQDVQDHLAECEFCNDALDGVKIWLDKAGTQDVTFSEHIMEINLSAQALIDKRKSAVTPVRRIHGYYRWAAIAALLLVFIGIFFVVRENPAFKKESLAVERNKNTDTIQTADEANLNKEAPSAASTEENNAKGSGKLKNRVKFVAPMVHSDEEVSESLDIHNADELTVTKEKDELAAESVPESRKAVGGTDIKKSNKYVAEEVYEKPFTVVEQMPAFPGGEVKMMKFLRENIKYPQQARESGISGTVYVTFVVEKNGKISDVKILRGIGGGCDEEALRVIRSMPSWIPGKQNGKVLPVQFNLPIHFTLQ